MKFISTRCSNVNRDTSVELKPAKKTKIDDVQKHEYPSVVASDAVSFERNMKRMSTEMEKVKPNPEILVDLMKQTFPNRRDWIIQEGHHVSLVCEKFPLLKYPIHVSTLIC